MQASTAVKMSQCRGKRHHFCDTSYNNYVISSSEMVCFSKYSSCSVCVVYFVNICVPSVFHTDDVFAINVYPENGHVFICLTKREINCKTLQVLITSPP